MKSPTKEVTPVRRASARLLPALLALCAGWVVSSLPACASHVAADVSPCPCAAGYICCASGVCASDESSCEAATLALSTSVEGTWTGYFESFWTTDDLLRVSLSVDANSDLSGTVVIGSSQPPAPATNPELPWPDSDLPSTALPARLDSARDFLPQPDIFYIPGYAYPLRNVRWEQHRLRFTIDSFRPWQPWCQLQTSYEDPAGSFSCTPTEDVSTDSAGNCLARTTPPTLTPCFKFVMCGIYCSCDTTGCTAFADADLAAAAMNTGASSIFDIAIRDGVGDGSAYVSFHGTSNVRLTKDP